jgi:RimJ/RimL family protein N-acetyltransferase
MHDGTMSGDAFTKVPVLTGPRVRLRAPRIEDAEAVFEAFASDAEVTRYLSWRPHTDVAETRRVITEFYNVGDHTAWLIEWRESGEIVGVCGTTRLSGHAVELGYCLGRQWWGRGIMTEVVSVLLDAIRRGGRIYRVAASCHPDNAASAAVLRRSGLTFEGRLARYALLPNLADEPQDMLLFGVAVR